MVEWIYITLFVGAPIFVPILGLWWLGKQDSKSHKYSLKFYQINVGGSRLSITKKSLLTLIFWIFPFFWFSFVLPFMTLPLIAIALLFCVRGIHPSTVELSEKSRNVSTTLQNIQKQVLDAKSHIEQLATEIQLKQVEIEEKDKIKKSLHDEIENRLQEVEEWRNLSQKQKSLFIEAAQDALNRTTFFRVFVFVMSTVALNIMATVIWTLLNSPGKERLIELYERIKTFL